MRALYPLLYGPLREQHPCQSNSGCCFDNFLGLWGCSRKGSRRGGRNPTPMVALPNASAIFHKQNTEPNWQPLQTTSCFVNPVSVAISVPQSVLYGGSPVPRGLGGGASFGNRSPGGVGGECIARCTGWHAHPTTRHVCTISPVVRQLIYRFAPHMPPCTCDPVCWKHAASLPSLAPRC